MGFLHRRELLISPVRPNLSARPVRPSRIAAAAVAIALLAGTLACDQADDEPEPGAAPDSAAAAPADTAVTLVGALPDGGPMPAAASAGGIPPYEGARVHTSRRQTSEMRSFEAYTPDDWTTVAAWYDSQLGPPEWSRVLAEEIVIYEKGEDQAAITVSAWIGESLKPGVPEYMRSARTAIGAAWRP